MQYNYLSPSFMVFLIGLVFVIILLILLPIFLNIDCGEKIKPLLCEIQNTSTLDIILNVSISIVTSFIEFLLYKIINDFTLFHFPLIFSSELFMNDVFDLIINYNNTELILSIITFSINTLFILVFLEIIELNFCDLILI